MITREKRKITKPDIDKIRIDFPILKTNIYGHSLVYFDNAATTQKPSQVIDSISDYYKNYNSNVHRGVHHLSQMATDRFEEARKTVQKYINAESEREIIFTKGTSDSINLVSASFGKEFVKKGDRVLISAMEHHSNIVPWQILCEDREARLDIIPINDKGELIFEEYEKLLDSDIKIIALPYVSNSMGTINPVKKIIDAAHDHGIPVLLDAAQAVQHIPVDVTELDVDFLAFSAHKIYGPTGMGILYGKEKWLDKMPPYQGGGEMIHTVTLEKTTYNDLPFKFEAGTPNIAGAIGLDAALKYISNIGIESINDYEHQLYQYALEKLSSVEHIRFIGEAEHRTGAISFILEKAHPFDVGEILDKQGIAVRTGHHCTEPIMDFFEIPGTVRASFAFYNTQEEVDRLVLGLNRAIQMLF